MEIFAISKIFWVNYKEFPENYSGNLKLTLGKFHRIKKVNETSVKFYEKLDVFKKFNNIEEFGKTVKFLGNFKNFEEIEELVL